MDVSTPEFSPESPLLVGDDDGSPARLVLCQAYWGTPGHTWTKGDVAWVAGAEVDDAIARRLICPIAAAPTAPDPTSSAPRRPAASAPTLVADTAEVADEEVGPVDTYDLDAAVDPAPTRTTSRPRRTSAA